MKRLHVSIGVEDLDASLAFYTTLFGTPPTKKKPDYAQWMLDDPRVNFVLDGKFSSRASFHNFFNFLIPTFPAPLITSSEILFSTFSL